MIKPTNEQIRAGYERLSRHAIRLYGDMTATELVEDILIAALNVPSSEDVDGTGWAEAAFEPATPAGMRDFVVPAMLRRGPGLDYVKITGPGVDALEARKDGCFGSTIPLALPC